MFAVCFPLLIPIGNNCAPFSHKYNFVVTSSFSMWSPWLYGMRSELYAMSTNGNTCLHKLSDHETVASEALALANMQVTVLENDCTVAHHMTYPVWYTWRNSKAVLGSPVSFDLSLLIYINIDPAVDFMGIDRMGWEGSSVATYS